MRRVAILGATLWTDYRVNGSEVLSMEIARRLLNDHRLIGYGLLGGAATLMLLGASRV